MHIVQLISKKSIFKQSSSNALEVIKKNKLCSNVIMFTNYPYPQYRRKCMDLGADFFLDKSTDFEKLTEVLKQLIHDNSQGHEPNMEREE